MGLESIPVIKILLTAWQLLAGIYVIINCVGTAKRTRIFNNTFIILILLYHLWLLFVTLTLQHGINAGLKKIFIAPIAVMSCYLLIHNNPDSFFRTALGILFAENLLNLMMWNVKVFYGDQFLLGIRTDFPVYGLIATTTAIVCIKKRITKKLLPYLTIILSITSIAAARVSTGLVSMALIIMLSYMIRYKRMEKLFDFISNKKLVTASLLVNAGIVAMGLQKYFVFLLTTILHESIYLNGRTIIWDAAIPLIKQSPWRGYGVYGVNIELPSWWGGSLNYTHNQLLQLMLDGGIVATVLFLLCIIVTASNIDKVKDYYFRKMSTIILFVITVTFIPESYANYLCFYVLFSTLAFIGSTDSMNKNEEEN